MESEEERKLMEEMISSQEEVNIAIVKNKAYWVKNNKLYSSLVNEFGDVDIRTTKAVDVFSLTTEELTLILKVVDRLNLD